MLGYGHTKLLKKINPLTVPALHFNLSGGGSGSAEVRSEDNGKNYKRIGRFLVQILQAEYEAKGEMIAGLSPKHALDQLKSQLASYSTRVWPFQCPCRESDDPMTWWEHLSKHPDAQVLAVSNTLLLAHSHAELLYSI
jgi:hypothetical protein